MFSGCVFPSKCRKNANTKNFEGGRGGGRKKIFVLVFFGCFFRSLSFARLPTQDSSGMADALVDMGATVGTVDKELMTCADTLDLL